MPVFYHGKSAGQWAGRARQYVSGFFGRLWHELNTPGDRVPPRDLYRQDDRIPPPVQKPIRNDALVKLRESFNDRVNDLAQQYANGEITPAQWRTSMAVEVRVMHVGSRVAGAGGFGALGPEDMQETERIIREQQGYLNRWADELRQSDVPLSADAIAARARMYGAAANTTFDRAEVAASGMPALPAYPGEESSCMVNCKCHWTIKKLDDNGSWDCYWSLNPSIENCENCQARARAWSPLKIRAYKVQPYNQSGLFAKHVHSAKQVGNASGSGQRPFRARTTDTMGDSGTSGGDGRLSRARAKTANAMGDSTSPCNSDRRNTARSVKPAPLRGIRFRYAITRFNHSAAPGCLRK